MKLNHLAPPHDEDAKQTELPFLLGHRGRNRTLDYRPLRASRDTNITTL